jgi:putative transposase
MNVLNPLSKSGGRKIYLIISKYLRKKEIKMGRDKLFSYLRSEYLLIAKRKKYHKTTNSQHWMRKYPNRIKNIDIVRPEQV